MTVLSRWQDLYVLRALELLTSPTSHFPWLTGVASNPITGGCRRKNSGNVRLQGTLPVSVYRNRPDSFQPTQGGLKT